MDYNYDDDDLNEYPVRNFCPVCSHQVQSASALIHHMKKHDPNDYRNYAQHEHNSDTIQASQQQLADCTIDNIYQKSNNTGAVVNRDADVQSQVLKTEYHIKDIAMDRNVSNVPRPFINSVTAATGNTHLQMPASPHLRYLTYAFGDTKIPVRNYQNTQAERNYVAAGAVGQPHENNGFQQETAPVTTNMQVPYDAAQFSSATIRPETLGFAFENSGELLKLLAYSGCQAQNVSNDPMQINDYQISSRYMDKECTSTNTGQAQPRVEVVENTNKNDIICEDDYVVYCCTLCGHKFVKKQDAAKHRILYHNDVKKNTRVFKTYRTSQHEYDTVRQQNINAPQQVNTAVLPRVLSEIITIEDDELEQPNYSQNNSLQATSEKRANKLLRHSLEHKSQTEHNDIKNTNMIKIRNPAAVNNLVSYVNTGAKLSFSDNQHNNISKKDYSTLNARNNIDENKYNNMYKSKALDTKNKRTLESVTLNENNKSENKGRNLEKFNNPNVKTKRLKRSHMASSSQYDTSKNKDGQNHINKANENDQENSNNCEFGSDVFSSNLQDTSKNAENQTQDNISQSKGKRSNEIINKQPELSIVDITENNNLQQLKTKIQTQSYNTRRESLQFNTSDFPIDENFKNLLESWVIEFSQRLSTTKGNSKKEPKPKLFKCRLCPTHFLKEEELRKHLTKKRHNRKRKNCVTCQLEFSKKSFWEHVIEHHKNKDLKLEDFDIVTELSSTSSDSSDSSTSADDSASNYTSDSPSLVSHKRTSSERKVKQNNENKHSKPLKDNLKVYTSVKNSNNIKTADNKQQNTNSSHSSRFLIFKCAECEKCFHNTGTLDKHKRYYCGKKSKTIKCDLCPLKFAERSLQKHREKHHSPTTLTSVDLFILGKTIGHMEKLTLAKREKNVTADELQKVSPDSKPTPKIMKTQKGKLPKELLQKTFLSYSRTLYKCRYCDVHFATAPTMQSHINMNNHAMITVTKCSICKLPFSSLSLVRHRNYHHGHLGLKKKTDFTIKVRPVLKVTTTKNIRNSEKSSVNNKNRLTISKRAKFSPEQKRKVSEKSLHTRHESDQRKGEHKESTPEIPKDVSNQDQPKEDKFGVLKKQKVCEKSLNTRHESDQRLNNDMHKERTAEISKDVSNQDRFNTRENLNTLYKCTQCDICFMEKKYLADHLAANHEQVTELYHCKFCNYRLCVSFNSYKLHIKQHYNNKPIILILDNTTEALNTIQTSYNKLNNDKINLQLKECFVKLPTLQSTFVSTTSLNLNSKPEANLKQHLNSQVLPDSDYSSPNVTTSAYEKSIYDKEYQLSEEIDNNSCLTHNDNNQVNELPNHSIQDYNCESEEPKYHIVVEPTAVNENDDLFTTQETFEENLTNYYCNTKEHDRLIEYKIHETLKYNVENDNNEELRNTVIVSNSSHKSIQILSNIVIKQPTKQESCNEMQSINILKDNEVAKNIFTGTPVSVNITDTNLINDIKYLTPSENSINSVNDGQDLLENSKFNSEKHPSMHKTAANLITIYNKISDNFAPHLETDDSSDSQSILASSYRTESNSKPKQCCQIKPNIDFSFGSVEVSETPKNIDVLEVIPKLNKDLSKSTEELLNMLEDKDNSKQEMSNPDEVQQNHYLESPSNVQKDTFVTKNTVTGTDHDNVLLATNQSEIDNLITKSNFNDKSYIPTEISESSESDKSCRINKELINITKNNLEIVTINDDEPVKNEQVDEKSSFIDDLYEINTENNSNDGNRRKLDRKLINIKLPTLVVTPHVNPDYPKPDEDLIEFDDGVSSSTNGVGTVQCQRDNASTIEENEDFTRDVEYVIANIKKEPDADDIAALASSDVVILISDDDDE